VVEGFGFQLKRISGSHHIFKHPDVNELLSLQPTENGRAKPYQVRQFLALVEGYNLQLEQESSQSEDETEGDER
jgi:hypothetical protein